MSRMMKKCIAAALSVALATIPPVSTYAGVVSGDFAMETVSEDLLVGDGVENDWGFADMEESMTDPADLELPEEEAAVLFSEETPGSGTASGNEAVSDNSAEEKNEDASEKSEATLASPYTSVFSGMEPKAQTLRDGTVVAMKGQKILLGLGAVTSDRKIIAPGKGALGKAKKTGTAHVTFIDGTSADINVVAPMISMRKLALAVGGAADLKVSAGGAEDKGLKIAWMTSNPNVAQVADGHVVAVGAGKAKIYAAIGGKALSCSVKVTDKPGCIAVVNAYTGGKSAAIPVKNAKKETWTIADSSVAMIAKGKIQGLKEGKTIVSGNSHTLLTYVDNTDVKSLSVSLKAGEQALIKECAHAFPIWKSKNPGIASVSEWGCIIGESDGTTQVTGKIGKTKVKINVMVSGKADRTDEEPTYPYKTQVIDGINNNAEVHIHYNDRGDYYLHSGPDGENEEPSPEPIPEEKLTGGDENGFTYEIDEEGDAIIKDMKADKYDGTNMAYRDDFSLVGKSGEPWFIETNIGETGTSYLVKNDVSVQNVTAILEGKGQKVAPDISKVKEYGYSWGVDTAEKDGKTVKTFRRLYTDPDTGWIFYVIDNERAYIIAHDDLRPYDNDPESLDDTKETRRPGSDEKIPVDENSNPNLDPNVWQNDDNPDESGKSNGWRRKHTDPSTGMVFILNDEKNGAIIVGAGSPGEDENGNITIPETVHKNALGGSYPVVGIMGDAFDKNSPAAEITVKGNNSGKKDVSLMGDFVKTDEAADGSFVYKRFFHDDSISAIVNKTSSGYVAEVIGASCDQDTITIPKTIPVTGKDVAKVTIKSVDRDAFNGLSEYVSESGENLITDIPWAVIIAEDPSVLTGGDIPVRSASVREAIEEYFFQRLPDGSYRQMFVDARKNPAPTGEGDKGATGYIFYVIKAKDGKLRAVITSYDYDNYEYFENAPHDVSIKDGCPSWVNKTGTMIEVDDAQTSIREDEVRENMEAAVLFDANGGKVPISSKTVMLGQKYGELPVPEYEGFDFKGWTTERNGDVVITSESRVETKGDHTLYAKWVIGTYTLTFDANGGISSPAPKRIVRGEKYGTLGRPSAYMKEGHTVTFAGWFTERDGGAEATEDTVMGFRDVTIYAHWTETKNSYRLSFNANGGYDAPSAKTIEFGSELGELGTPTAYTKTGHTITFSGWYTERNGGEKVTTGTRMGAKNMTVYAHWGESINSYKLRYDANGGTEAPVEKTLEYGSKYGELGTPTEYKKTGHTVTFAGWFDSRENGSQVTAETTIDDRDTTIYAHWTETKNSYRLTFDANGGTSETESKRILYGDRYGTLGEPTAYHKDHYTVTFDGWYDDRTGGNKVTADTVMGAGDAVVYAHWIETIDRFTLTFNANGGFVTPGSKSVDYGSRYGTLPEATPYQKTGYTVTFNGWYSLASGGDKITSDTIMGDGNVTIYAHWTETKNSYKLTFNANEGSNAPAQKTILFGDKYGTLGTPTAYSKTGYDVTFDGWYDAKIGGNKVSEETTMGGADATIYAHWKETARNYKLSFSANGGSDAPAEKTVAYGTAYGSLGTPTAYSKTGYTVTFAGWFTSPSGGSQVTASTTMGAGDTMIYAHWTESKNSYKLYFSANGGTGAPSTKTIEYGGKYGTLGNPTAYSKTGYTVTFAGWYTSKTGGSQVNANTTIGASDVTIYAHWSESINSYKLTFDANAGSNPPSAKTITYGAKYGTLGTPTAYTKSGYDVSFIGWYTAKTGGTKVTENTTMGGSNTTIYAHWQETKNTYTIKWTSPIATLGSYLGTAASPTGLSSKAGWKRVRYTKPDGTTAYISPYSAGSIEIKKGTTVDLQMVGAKATDRYNNVVDWATIGSASSTHGYTLNNEIITASLTTEESCEVYMNNNDCDYYDSENNIYNWTVVIDHFIIG